MINGAVLVRRLLQIISKRSLLIITYPLVTSIQLALVSSPLSKMYPLVTKISGQYSLIKRNLRHPKIVGIGPRESRIKERPSRVGVKRDP